jgi:hypothetical protein
MREGGGHVDKGGGSCRQEGGRGSCRQEGGRGSCRHEGGRWSNARPLDTNLFPC